jgi:hypothetical protein
MPEILEVLGVLLGRWRSLSLGESLEMGEFLGSGKP